VGVWERPVEIMGMSPFSDVYRGRRVLITGHSGFKGSWLALWLQQLGAAVVGVSLKDGTEPSHWNLLNLSINDRRMDIRDGTVLQQLFDQCQPEMVFHLAAQSLVRRSYLEPIETWSTNVLGTANVLEACRNTPSVRAVVVVTTDKCYQNREWPWGYRETDRLGGHDPYSASKAATELVAASYRSSFFGLSTAPLVATARAGNVIGGGDWSEDRLVPDLVRAMQQGKSLEIRSPASTRPWQHVLDALSGYLFLGQRLVQGETLFADAWNFGPSVEGNKTVSEVLSSFKKIWDGVSWHVSERPATHEANLLYLDSAKARNLLRWKPIWNVEEAIEVTAAWYKDWMSTGRIASVQNLDVYMADAKKANAEWCAR
jgi:CDP-glucose 4,6-dehydratase